jgi:hypothetical protein
MQSVSIGNRVGHGFVFATALLGSVVAAPGDVRADESGVSFWLPGLFGSLAAVPQQTPGWNVTTIYYHTSVSGGGELALARDIQAGRIPINLNASVNGAINGTADLSIVIPTYVFATPVFGGQASAGFLGIYGNQTTNASGTISGTLGLPGGINIPFMRSNGLENGLDGFGDLYPQFALKWNMGVHNFMTYATGDIPVGAYDSTRIANIGIGHGAIDGGGGYTYFDPKSGHEFSAVGGFTYNFINPSTNYQSGIDFHLDMAASQFLSKQLFVGAVGYIYQQVTGDSGSGDRVGAFESRVASIGPQIGYIFPINNNMQGYVNAKAYFEFDNQNRPAGWNTWLTFSISPAAPPAATPSPTRAGMIFK